MTWSGATATRSNGCTICCALIPARACWSIGTVRAEEFGGVTDGVAHDGDDHPLAALMSALHGDGQLTELELGPLDAGETASLAAFMAERDLTSEQAARLFQETEGNPLFVVETVRFGLETRDRRTETGGGRVRSTIAHQKPALAPAQGARRLAVPPVAAFSERARVGRPGGRDRPRVHVAGVGPRERSG